MPQPREEFIQELILRNMKGGKVMGRQFVIRVKCVAHKLPLVENGALFPFERGKVSGEYVLDKNGLRCVKEGEDGLKCDFTIFAGWEDGPRASWWGDAPIPSIEMGDGL